MKNTVKILLLSLFCLALLTPEMQATTSPDTLVFKRKITYGGQKIKNMKALKSILETANDAETMRLFQKFKNASLFGSAASAVGGGLAFLGSLEGVKGDAGGDFRLTMAGLGVAVVGLVVVVTSRGKLKKAVNRFNDIKMGRIQPSVSFQKEPSVESVPMVLTPKNQPPEIVERPVTPPARLVNMEPRRTPPFFRNDSLSNLKPVVGNFGISLKAAGLKGLAWENSFDSLTLQFRKMHRPTIVLRADLSLVSQSLKTGNKNVFTNGDYSYDENRSKLFVLGLAPGIEKHFPGTRRLDPYAGAALPFAFAGKLRTTDINDDVDADGTYLKRETIRTEPGGFGIGLDGFVGVNYYVADRIALGVEYGLGFSLLNFSGKSTYKLTTKSKPTVTGPETTTIIEKSDDEQSFRTTFLGNKGVAGLNLTFWLSR